MSTKSGMYDRSGLIGIDPRDFGAIGDGKTDDTEAIQKALDASACKRQDNLEELAEPQPRANG